MMTLQSHRSSLIQLGIASITAFIILSHEITSAENSTKTLPSYECLVSYAKLQGIKDIALNATEVEYDSTKPECTMARQNLISNVRIEIRSRINEVEILPRYTNCIYEKLTGSESFVHSVIKAAIFEHSDGNKTMNSLNTTIGNILKEINNSIDACRREDELGNEFDVIFNSTSDGTKNLSMHEDYCIKKYLIKNNLIDIYTYEVDPNPHNINVTGLNCEEMIRKENEKVYDELSTIYFQKPNLSNDEKVECAIEKFREADYFDLVMRIIALSTLNTTPEQRGIERERFIEIFTNITSRIAAC